MAVDSALAALDAAIEALREESAFALAQHGLVPSATLARYGDELAAVRVRAFEAAARAGDLTLPKRDRDALRAHAADIARAVVADVDTVRGRFRDKLAKTTADEPGMRAVVEAAVHRTAQQAEVWWGGRLRLGTLTSPTIAAKDWREYRRTPRWVVWTAVGAAGATSVGATVIALLF